MKKITKIILLVYTLTCFLAACGKDHKNDNLVTISGLTMGTVYTIKINAMDHPIDKEKLGIEVDEMLLRLNDTFSTYIDTSELSRINQSAQTDWIPVSRDLLTVVEQALVVSRLSNGAFDITVGPLVNLWGFGPGTRNDIVPEEDQIRSVMQKTGYQYLETRHDPPAIKKLHADLYLDLSGIAKGYAVDVLAAYIENMGILDYLVDIGGEIRARGNNPDDAHWRIGIEKPVTNGRMLQEVMKLDNAGMATSGDYRNYFESDGVRYSHTIDPATGKPITHKLASVTVISPTAMYADAVATALMVLGPDKGFVLAESEKLPVLFIVKTNTGFAEKATSSMQKYITR